MQYAAFSLHLSSRDIHPLNLGWSCESKLQIHGFNLMFLIFSENSRPLAQRVM